MEETPELETLRQAAVDSLRTSVSEKDEQENSREETQASEKICPSCGERYPDTANFCAKCGTALILEQKPEQTNIMPEQAQQEPSTEEASVQIPVTQTKKERYFEETTLLGFTNFGETSVLDGGGMGGNYFTPYLIRSNGGEKVFITKRNFLIGKSAQQADYSIQNTAVSRVHAQINAVGNEYYIVDQNSTNHTYVNGKQIEASTSVKIVDGDEIKLADEVLTFHLS